MAIDQQDLGRRLRQAREARHLTQDDVARHLEVSRPTVAQMELGNRAVTGLELSHLGYLFGVDPGQLLADAPGPDDDVVVGLFRSHPELARDADMQAALRECLALARELTRLEHLLGIDRDQATLAAYPLPRPHNRWDAIQQGERVAAEERRRLELGIAPLPDVSELLEVQGVRTARIDLPDDVSGLTLMAPDLGFFVVANRAHPTLRRRFSCAHEYGHVLVDREARSLVSLGRDRDQLVEVRANAFAAAFLMPEAAVRHLVRTLGKGHPSRAEAEVFDEQAPVKARARTAPGSQAIQLYDVVHVAHHFGVSRPAALYRLKSLKLVTEPELQALRDQDGAGQGRALARVLGLPGPTMRACATSSATGSWASPSRPIGARSSPGPSSSRWPRW